MCILLEQYLAGTESPSSSTATIDLAQSAAQAALVGLGVLEVARCEDSEDEADRLLDVEPDLTLNTTEARPTGLVTVRTGPIVCAQTSSQAGATSVLQRARHDLAKRQTRTHKHGHSAKRKRKRQDQLHIPAQALDTIVRLIQLQNEHLECYLWRDAGLSRRLERLDEISTLLGPRRYLPDLTSTHVLETAPEPLYQLAPIDRSTRWETASLRSGIESLPPSEAEEHLPEHAPSPSASVALLPGRRRFWLKRSELEAQRAARSPSTYARGASAVPRDFLLPSIGPKRSEIPWPRHGDNTVQSRLQEISCDVCQGRLHWACAGLGDADNMTRETYRCPPCLHTLAQSPRSSMDGSRRSSARITPVPAEERHRCMRPDCVLRSSKPVKRKANDMDRFAFERIIGRKVIRRKTNAQRIFEFLVKWSGWEIYDATWQSPRDIGKVQLEEQHELFLDACYREQVSTSCRVSLLPEAEEWWDEKGELKRVKLKMLGVPDAPWWD